MNFANNNNVANIESCIAQIKCKSIWNAIRNA